MNLFPSSGLTLSYKTRVTLAWRKTSSDIIIHQYRDELAMYHNSSNCQFRKHYRDLKIRRSWFVPLQLKIPNYLQGLPLHSTFVLVCILQTRRHFLILF